MIYDLAIIGGGPAGYTAAELAGKHGLRAILFEKNSLGGVCLNEGCIPTKTLLYSAKLYQSAKESAKYGVFSDNPRFDLARILARKNKIVRKLNAGIKMRLKAAEVEVIQAEAFLADSDGTGQHRIVYNDCDCRARKVLLCSGSEAIVPPIPGLTDAKVWTHREALENSTLPESLLIIGGGVIGIEFASFFRSFGSQVSVIEMASEILPGVDREVASLLRSELERQGISFYLNTKVVAIHDRTVAVETSDPCASDPLSRSLEATQILLAVGRRPMINTLSVNEFMQTSDPDVYLCGDANGVSLLAHTAVREAEIAVGHILGQRVAMDYHTVPSVIYTAPELASVGDSEENLQGRSIPYAVHKLPMTYSGRFVAENESFSGLCKILTSESGLILGVHLLGSPASELITIATIAITKGMTASDLKSIIFPHPTVAEIIRETL
jgi:dihydrolipoamide dehydrogenase